MRAPQKNGRRARSGAWKKIPRLPIRYLALITVPLAAAACVFYVVAFSSASSFAVTRIVFTGNEHLTEEELRTLAGVRPGDNLLTLSSRAVYSKMMGSPWIRSVSVRKELPDAVHVRMEEAAPLALLDMKGRLFIIDDKGKMLEELRNNQVPFLPVIAGDPFTKKDAFLDAISLVKALKNTGFAGRKDHIEIIAQKSEELAMNADGIVVKFGAGEYEAKLGRLTDLEEEIKKRQIPVDYIDLRFSNKVIVKPVHEVIKR